MIYSLNGSAQPRLTAEGESATVAPMQPAIRLADPNLDADAVAAIYTPAVVASIASLEELPPSPAEMAERMRRVLIRTPWLVAELTAPSSATRTRRTIANAPGIAGRSTSASTLTVRTTGTASVERSTTS